MRDPRLAEIEFLMDMERSDVLHVRTSPIAESGATATPNQPGWNRYGMSTERFRDMIVYFINSGIVAGPFWRSDDRITQLNQIDLNRHSMLIDAVGGRVLVLNVTHAGRVHLWKMRDALMRDPDLEPFGLRSRAAWERDLFLNLQWASTNQPLAMIFLDLDNFGVVNKTLGAPVGDSVLRVVFGLVKNIVGTRGVAYRYGGEEIGVLLPGLDQQRALGLAEELRETIERDTHAQVSELAAPQTASLGVATFDRPIANDAAVARVDVLMRMAKQAGKNRVSVG